MEFNALAKEFEKAGYYLQDLGNKNYLNRYRFTSMYVNDEGIQITKNHTHTIEDLERILKLLTIRRLGKYEVEVVKLILDEASSREFSEIMTIMEKEYNIPALNDPAWNEKNKDIIYLYHSISSHRELVEDWDLEI